MNIKEPQSKCYVQVSLRKILYIKNFNFGQVS
jgi:hypothetical protein